MSQDLIRPTNDCLTTGGKISCPADSLLEFDGVPAVLRTDITCPLNAVDQSNFREVSQEGRCDCTASLVDENGEPAAAGNGGVLDCPICYICPEQTNQFGIAFECTTPVFLQCTSFNCNGECNGDIRLNAETDAPTKAPDAPSMANANANIGFTTALFILVLFRMIH